MNDAVNNADVIESGRLAWNTLTSLLDGEAVAFDNNEEFKEFYTLMLDRLFEEGDVE